MPPIPLMKGTLDLLVLKALSWTPMHGVEITSWLEERSGLIGPLTEYVLGGTPPPGLLPARDARQDGAEEGRAVDVDDGHHEGLAVAARLVVDAADLGPAELDRETGHLEHDAGHVDEGRHERRRGTRWIEAHPPDQERQHRGNPGPGPGSPGRRRRSPSRS